MPKDARVWTKLMLQQIKGRQGREALILYHNMRKEGVVPSHHTFVAALKACSIIPSVGAGKIIHSHVSGSGETNLFVTNTLLDMYAKCGSIHDACHIFEKMKHRDVVSWNVMILAYAHMEMGTVALELYARMQREGFAPDDRTFIATLKACATMVSQEEDKGADPNLVKAHYLKQVTAIHAEVKKKGFDSRIFVANALIDTYARCGSVENARSLFEKIKYPDMASWNTMIIGYAHIEMGNVALELYARMRNEGFTPNERTFVAVLKACGSVATQEGKGADCQLLKKCYLEQGRTIHAELAEREFESNIFVANSLVDMYVKCGSIQDACWVFENMRIKNAVTWNAIISGYAQTKMGDLALQFYARMQNEGFSPNERTFVALLKACATLAVRNEVQATDLEKISYLERGRAIHAEAIKRGFESSIFVANTLVDMYAKFGSIGDARQVFDKISHRNVVSWNAMIIGYAQMEMGDLALELYARMQGEGFTADTRTFVAALKACASLAVQEEGKGVEDRYLKKSYLEQGRAIHCEVAKRGLESYILIANTLVDMYAKCGSIEDARHVFEKMRHRDLVSWNAMITGYAQMEMGDLALELYACMQSEGFKPDNRTFVAALKACASLAAQAEGKGADRELLKTNYLAQGRAIHAEVARRGLQSDIFITNTLVDMYANCGSITDACKVFKKMRHQDVVSWNAMIIGYAQVEMGDLALKLYAHMQNEGFIPNDRTFVAALKACTGLALQESNRADKELLKFSSLEQGRSIHAEAVKGGYESDIFVANAMVDMYAKCGSIEDAEHVFGKMRHRDVVSWTAMITGYSQMGMGDSALQLYVRMQHEGFTPNAHTFVAALHACGSLASLEIGKAIHFQIQRGGLQEQSFLANCLIDMYGKCGSTWDAQQVFNSLLVRNSVTWNALISGYSAQGDSEHVFNLYEKMQQEDIKPGGVTFVSILNVCSHNGLVEKGQMYFQAMCLEHEIIPSHNHYTCIIDLLGRAGLLDEAADVVMKMPFEPSIMTWMTIFASCQKWNNVETAMNAFECVMMSDET